MIILKSRNSLSMNFVICIAAVSLIESWFVLSNYKTTIKHRIFSFVRRCICEAMQKKDEEKNVEIVRDTRDFSRGADVAELRFIGFLNHGDVAVEDSLIDFSGLTLAPF